MGSAAFHRLSIAEYIAFEEQSEIRHEFYNGEIFDMSGASPVHVDITENISGLLYQALKGKPCRGRSSDMRVRIEETGFYTYPDVLIVCDEPRYAEDDPNSLVNPIVIFEVLSPSTEKHDRTFKLDQYRLIPSLDQYVLVAQDGMRVDTYTRTANGWGFESYTKPEAMVEVPVGDVRLLVADLYDGIQFAVEEPKPI